MNLVLFIFSFLFFFSNFSFILFLVFILLFFILDLDKRDDVISCIAITHVTVTGHMIT